jgi:hypothetical protein
MSAAIAGATIVAASAALARARYFIAVPHPVVEASAYNFLGFGL